MREIRTYGLTRGRWAVRRSVGATELESTPQYRWRERDALYDIERRARVFSFSPIAPTTPLSEESLREAPADEGGRCGGLIDQPLLELAVVSNALGGLVAGGGER